MARYGVLGDIHANGEALDAALAGLDALGVKNLLCLGDIVGYNADPIGCIQRLRARHACAVAGNHDLIGIGRLGFERTATKVEYSLRRTRRALSREAAEYLATLPARRAICERIVLIHGGVRAVDEYIASPPLIARNAAQLREDFPQARICLFGHTHHPKVYEVQGDEVRELPAVGRVALRKDRVYFVNPGSVDPSRKRDSRLAQYAVLDTEQLAVEFLSAPYDHARAESRARTGGYRIGPVMDRLYEWRRRYRGSAPFVAPQ
jgi:predicted phosphodiesterase